MKTKYHCQVVSARIVNHPMIGECKEPENPHRRVTRRLVVEGNNITDATEKATSIIKSWDGLWLLDGHPVKRGSQTGHMIG